MKKKNQKDTKKKKNESLVYGCGLKFKTARKFIADEYEFLMVTLEHACWCTARPP